MKQFLVIILIIILVLFNIFNNSDQDSSSTQQQIQAKPTTQKQIHTSVPSYSYTEENTISEIYDDGRIIEMLDGSVYEVYEYDTITSTLWLPMIDVVITDDCIIKIEDNESVDYIHQLR